MVDIYGKSDFTRKITNIKDWLWDDGYYADKLICRVKTLSGDSGVYRRNVTVTYTDSVVSGIAEFGPIFTSYEEKAITIDGDVRFTCKLGSASTISGADELWLGNTFTSSGGLYASGTSNIVGGKMYTINSRKDSLFKYDKIYILKLAGEPE